MPHIVGEFNLTKLNRKGKSETAEVENILWVHCTLG